MGTLTRNKIVARQRACYQHEILGWMTLEKTASGSTLPYNKTMRSLQVALLKQIKHLSKSSFILLWSIIKIWFSQRSQENTWLIFTQVIMLVVVSVTASRWHFWNQNRVVYLFNKEVRCLLHTSDSWEELPWVDQDCWPTIICKTENTERSSSGGMKKTDNSLRDHCLKNGVAAVQKIQGYH